MADRTTEPHNAESTVREAYGASQIGPFDYCPKLGFREYWYPGVKARQVRRAPVHLKMLGEDLVFFRDKAGKVVALSDWCPHRGARLSLGLCEFEGTVTCPYHGYVFDGAGQCVAGLIERPDSSFAPKLRARVFPTEERLGIVFVWMGETAPAPLTDDLPAELLDPAFTGARYLRVKVWEANWTEPVAQGIDFHEFYLHRGVNVWRLFNYRLPFFRAKPVYTGGVKITSEGPTFMNAAWVAPHYGQAYYPGLRAKWPRHVWWRRLRGRPLFGLGDTPFARYQGVQHNVELPSKIRVLIGASIHLRWMVPVSEHDTRVWTFTVVRKPRTPWHAAWQALWYHGYRKPNILVTTNEKEDLVVFKRDRLNLESPQKLGPLDVGLIYFRRHLAQRARDYERLGFARGALKTPPSRRSAEAEPPLGQSAALPAVHASDRMS